MSIPMALEIVYKKKPSHSEMVSKCFREMPAVCAFNWQLSISAIRVLGLSIYASNWQCLTQHTASRGGNTIQIVLNTGDYQLTEWIQALSGTMLKPFPQIALVMCILKSDVKSQMCWKPVETVSGTFASKHNWIRKRVHLTFHRHSFLLSALLSH